MVLKWPGAQLCGVTTVAEHGGKRAGYALHALAIGGRSDIPVAAGADASLGCFNPWPALPDERRYWPENISPLPGPVDAALTLLERSIERGAVIAAIGPYTNLAMLERRRPGILKNARLVLMGGHPFPARDGYPNRGGETDYNIQADARSAYTVLQKSSPTLVPLSITVETALRRSELAALRTAGPLAKLIAKQGASYAADNNYERRYGHGNFAGLPDDIINFQHDPLTCAIALGWREGVKIHEMPVQSTLETGLVQQKIVDGSRPMRVVTQVDGSRFSDVWLERMTSKG